MKINCLYDELVDIKSLKLNPNNRNSHPPAQIERLAKVLDYQGWRYPVKVSKQTGMVTSGHGRVAAARKNGWKQVPVNYQDYDSPEMEYADTIADNAVASWSELDLSGINLDLADVGPFDIDMLGIDNFKVNASDKEEYPKYEEFTEEFLVVIKCDDEASQKEIFTELQARGLNLRLMQCKSMTFN